MNLFHLPFDKIKYDHIKSFCQSDIYEGTRVEFKREFPKNRVSAKVISSFANTYGGLFLIGIDSKDRKPIYPFIGESFKEGLEEKITSICLNSINPPVIPDISIVQFPDDPLKCIILVRIEESDQTPHRVENDTEIYIRANSESTPVKVKYGEIKWLVDRRRKAEQNKKRLLERATVRFNRFSHNLRFNQLRCVYIIPRFPSRTLFTMPEFSSLLQKTTLRYDDTMQFPCNFHILNTQFESFIFTEKSCNDANILEDVKYMEIGRYGLIWNKESFWENRLRGVENQIRSRNVMLQLLLTCSFALKFYEKIGYWGSVEIGHYMFGILGKSVDPYNSKSLLDNDFAKIIYTNISSLQSNLDSIVVELFQEFLWSTGNIIFANNKEIHLEMLNTIKSEIREAE